MDPELQKKIDAARAEGYTDEEINNYLGLRTAQTNAQVQGQTPPPEVQPQAEISSGPGAAEVGAIAGGLGAQYALPAAGLGAAALGGGKLYGAWRQSAEAAKNLAEAKMASEKGIMERAAAKAAGRAPMPAGGPIAPGAAPQIINPATGQPFAAAPAAAPAQAAPQTMLDKTTQMMKQIAANKVLQNTLRLGGAAAFAAQPSDLGPQVPQKGQFRGMEINPMTRRPWTREELAALNR